MRPIRFAFIHAGRRRYTAADLARLRCIKSAQRLGFSLDEIGELLRLNDGTSSAEARLLGEGKLVEIRGKRSDLRGIVAASGSLITQCGDAREWVRCPLIDAVQHTGRGA